MGSSTELQRKETQSTLPKGSAVNPAEYCLRVINPYTERFACIPPGEAAVLCLCSSLLGAETEPQID